MNSEVALKTLIQKQNLLQYKYADKPKKITSQKFTKLSVNTRPVKRLTLVVRLPPAFYIGPHAGWNYGIVKTFL